MKNYFLILISSLSLQTLYAKPLEKSDILKKEWHAFSCRYLDLTCFTPNEIAALANHWGEKISKELKVTGNNIRKIDPEIVCKMLIVLQNCEVKILMRHGEQEKTTTVQTLSPALQKIAMMRLPDNQENTLTDASYVKWIEGMIIFSYLKQKTGKNFRITTSKNTRALLPAALLGEALNTCLDLEKRLNCVNYPPEEIMPAEEILKWLPEGSLPWEMEIVNRIIGPGTYEKITEGMRDFLDAKNSPCTIVLTITHTQQLNAAAQLVSLPVKRMGNYGFIVVTEKEALLFPEGFYK